MEKKNLCHHFSCSMTAADWQYLRPNILSVIGKGFRTRFLLVPAIFLLPLHLNQIRAVIVRNDSEGFSVVPHKYCFTGIFPFNSLDEIVFFSDRFQRESAVLLYFYLSFQRKVETENRAKQHPAYFFFNRTY